MGKYILLAMLVATILLFGCLDQIGSPASDQQAPGSQQGSNAINATPHVSGNETVKNTSVAPPVTQPKAVLPIEKNLSQGQTIQVGNSSIMLGDVQSSPDGLDYALLAVSDGKGNRVDSLKIKKLDSAVILIEGKAYEIKCLDVYVGILCQGYGQKLPWTIQIKNQQMWEPSFSRVRPWQ
ncbi:MAG: hypothetical protein NTY68_04575 [Candidatus Micrarchaeota archaeon]|nr:hypothetical protein [Candidatus Micrarchaeota archaeon]